MPKIHKNKIPPPGHPIISANEFPTERISQLVDFFLQPHLMKLKSYIKETTDFIIKISEIELDGERYILFTLDVTSLYTNIPHLEEIQAVRYFLEQHRRHGVTPFNTSIVDLLELVLTLNNFEFNGKHYLQIARTAMGTKVAPSPANIFMGPFKEEPVYNPELKFWYRFIDDIGLYKAQKMNLNSLYRTSTWYTLPSNLHSSTHKKKLSSWTL